MLGWMKHKLESRSLGEISITSDMQMTPPIYGRKWRKTKEPLDESKSIKAALKLNIQKTKIWSHHFMANRWGNNGNSERLYFGGLKNNCRWWLQPSNQKTLAPWKNSYDQPRQHIKSRDIALPTKVRLVKAVVFPVVMYGCESWIIKKAEHQRIDRLLNYGVGKDSLESLGLQGDPTSPS